MIRMTPGNRSNMFFTFNGTLADTILENAGLNYNEGFQFGLTSGVQTFIPFNIFVKR